MWTASPPECSLNLSGKPLSYSVSLLSVTDICLWSLWSHTPLYSNCQFMSSFFYWTRGWQLRPTAKSRPRSVFINQAHWNAGTPNCLRIAYGCFLTTTGELDSYDKDYMTHKTKTIYYMALYGKRLWTPYDYKFVGNRVLLCSSSKP